jgi:hypothetical protein
MIARLLCTTGLLVLAGCPITTSTEPFGQACVVEASAELSCPLDYHCDGACLPILDYGSCDAPLYGGGLGATRNELLINGSDDVAAPNLELVGKVNGSVNVQADGIGDLRVGSLCALRRVQLVGGRVTIAESDLTSLDGLQSLTAIGAGLVIVDNPQLTSLAALSSVLSVGIFQDVTAIGDVNIVIANNANLSQAEADAFAAPFGSNVRVCGNGDGSVPCQQLGPLLSELIGR